MHLAECLFGQMPIWPNVNLTNTDADSFGQKHIYQKHISQKASAQKARVICFTNCNLFIFISREVSFLNMGQPRPLFFYFPFSHQAESNSDRSDLSWPLYQLDHHHPSSEVSLADKTQLFDLHFLEISFF